MMMAGRGNRYPFTASQWEELEHQALIYKYMTSGIPIPSDLLLPFRRTFLLDSTTSTNTTTNNSSALPFPHHHHHHPPPPIGWGCFQVGFGRKGEDPEPGRCRRTDGKKWRCSKEAYPDSKYCERHMHRGKNRSRKPVEMSLATTTTTSSSSSSTTTTTTNNNNNNNNHHHPSLYPSPPPPPLSISTPDFHHLSYPYSSPSLGLSFLPQNNNANFHLDSTGSYYPTDKDYRYCNRMKDVDEYSFFSENSEAERDGSWQFRPLGMSSLGEPKHTGYLFHKEDEKQQHQQHCFVLGADFKLEKPADRAEREAEDHQQQQQQQRPLRHFFDEWPEKSKSSWMDLEEQSSSKTQLSISIPMAGNFPGYRHDD